MKQISTYRKIRHQASKTLLRAPIIWARHCGIDRNDVMVASYPRSGNTWLRFMLTRILTGKPGGFDNVNSVIAEIGIHKDALPLLPGDGRLEYVQGDGADRPVCQQPRECVLEHVRLVGEVGTARDR